MNKQEIFNKVATHLIQQGVPSVNSRGACMYRARDGSRCAVGCLIPDELYTLNIEGYGISKQQKEIGGPFVTILEELNLLEEVEFLVDLQNIHDAWAKQEDKNMSYLMDRLISLAALYDLELPKELIKKDTNDD